MRIICATVVSLLATSLILAVPARAGSVDITYDFAGGLTAPPVLNGVLLHLNGSATGAVDQYDPLVNAVWNPVTFVTADDLDLTTGLDSGTFTWTFANGEMLSGLMSEDDTMVDLMTNTGPFTQTLTFTDGTGEFAGIAGFSSGAGTITPAGYTISGNGTLTAPGLVAADEPESIALMLGGLLVAASGTAGSAGGQSDPRLRRDPGTPRSIGAWLATGWRSTPRLSMYPHTML